VAVICLKLSAQNVKVPKSLQVGMAVSTVILRSDPCVRSPSAALAHFHKPLSRSSPLSVPGLGALAQSLDENNYTH
jgi:hypothetical protein